MGQPCEKTALNANKRREANMCHDSRKTKSKGNRSVCNPFFIIDIKSSPCPSDKNAILFFTKYHVQRKGTKYFYNAKNSVPLISNKDLPHQLKSTVPV